nr:MAG TPA: helix-turn-helix domain protein [Crassvirales sp.]
MYVPDDNRTKLMETTVDDRSDDGKVYHKTIKYIPESTRISNEVLIDLLTNGSLHARKLFAYFIDQLPRNDNEIILDRLHITATLGLSPSAISRALQELKASCYIYVLNNKKVAIPIFIGCKGNINKQLADYDRRVEEEKQLALEREARRSIDTLAVKFRSKRKRKSKNNTDEQIPSN